MDDLEDTRVATDSEDDLNITEAVRKDLGRAQYIKSAPLFPHPYLKLWNDTPTFRSCRQPDLRPI